MKNTLIAATAIIFVAIPLFLMVILSFRLSPEDGAEIAGRAAASTKP